jgi:hypothetical protein
VAVSKGVEGLLINAGIPLAAALVTLASERVRGIVEATFRHPTRRSLIVRSRLLLRRPIIVDTPLPNLSSEDLANVRAAAVRMAVDAGISAEKASAVADAVTSALRDSTTTGAGR